MSRLAGRGDVGGRRGCGVVSSLRSGWTRRRARIAASLLGVALLGAGAGAGPAGAFEALDGRFQLHGFYEAQLRAISSNFSQDLDLTQWYNVLNLELEFDILDRTIGPLDLVSAYARVEARYDCVWTRGCGTMRSANTFGDRSESLPGRLSGARRTGFTGAVETGDRREIAGIPKDQLDFFDKDTPIGDADKPAFIFHVPGVDTLFSADDPLGGIGGAADYVFQRFLRPGAEYRFGLRSVPGAENGRQIQVLGPWLPRNEIFPRGRLKDRVNPFQPDDFHPVFPGISGSTAQPFRPAPVATAGRGSRGLERGDARGLFVPPREVARLYNQGKLGDNDVNYSQQDLSFNRGASQEDEGELKEFYFDIELFDARLWLRLGKQSIVWGKTELFRTTDQLNPQDLALASLPSLEESRISLWSARAVYSFYEVGPLSDVRVELALNFDQFEPVDIGRCGEPYAPNASCNKSFGLFAHGLAGQGIVGERRPEDPWDDISGLEGGVRIEFRWDRFSFAIIDFYGYDDFPVPEAIVLYRRNVDPETGRPRALDFDGPCTSGLEAACLRPVAQDAEGRTDPTSLGENNALEFHHANQQRFAVICASSVGFNALDPNVCAQSVLNSQAIVGAFPVSQILTGVLRGNSSDNGTSLVTDAQTGKNTLNGKGLFSLLAGEDLNNRFVPNAATFAGIGFDAVGNPLNGDLNQDGVVDVDDIPLVALTDDVFDVGGTPTDTDGPGSPDSAFAGLFLPFGDPTHPDRVGLNAVLTDEQEALLGCGPFWGSDCDADGIDLLNTEASIFAEAWPGAQGTFGEWDTTDPGRIQPGTVGFVGGAVCTRFVRGRTLVLPGCRGPGEDGYDRAIDGTPPDRRDEVGQPVLPGTTLDILRHPFTGQPFRSEMTAFSWNAAMLLVGFSGVFQPLDQRTLDEFNPDEPFADETCSFKRPQLCSVVQAFYAILQTTRATRRAGGNGTFGRANFDWHQGGVAVLRYPKRNVLGFSTDFAEDFTKSNWSAEFTWIEGLPRLDSRDRNDGLSEVDTYNLTVSVDRPTFINFLNSNRTFFINSQWFFQYVDGYRSSMPSNGPFNVLATLSVRTGYWQDRLLPNLTLVYDFASASGAGIPQVTFLYNAEFSVTLGAAFFFGRFQGVDPPIANVADDPFRAGRHQERAFVENGLSQIRERDEIFLRLRYTF